MRKAVIYLILFLFPFAGIAGENAGDASVAPGDSLASAGGSVLAAKGAFLVPLQERDSVLIADQLSYGFELSGVKEGTLFELPEWENSKEGGVKVISPWMIDTLKVTKAKKDRPARMDIKGSVVITSFDEGNFVLPQIVLRRMSSDGVVDTLVFEQFGLEVKTMPVDTASFRPHDIKEQVRYPVTLAEVLPWLLGSQAAAMLIILAVCLVILYRRRSLPGHVYSEPAHITALRRLDTYRGNKLWAPEKQKLFYSGITDTLREYISARYGIGAMEMTTAEIFGSFKDEDVPAELLGEVQELFELADFVKFAKHLASDEENASALPVAVKFVTQTYQSEIETAESGNGEGSEE